MTYERVDSATKRQSHHSQEKKDEMQRTYLEEVINTCNRKLVTEKGFKGLQKYIFNVKF
jgi:hypothetical protein